MYYKIVTFSSIFRYLLSNPNSYCILFQTLNLPQEKKDSRSSSDSSTKGVQDVHKTLFIGRDRPLEPRQPTYDPIKGIFSYW